MHHLIVQADSAKKAFLKIKDMDCPESYKESKRYYIVECLDISTLQNGKAIGVAEEFVYNPETLNPKFKLRNNTLGCIVLKSAESVQDTYMFFII